MGFFRYVKHYSKTSIAFFNSLTAIGACIFQLIVNLHNLNSIIMINNNSTQIALLRTHSNGIFLSVCLCTLT